MIKLNYRHLKVSRTVWILFFSLLLCKTGFADPFSDTSRKRLLASAKESTSYVTLEPNVVFPDVFTGIEKEAMEYVEKFAANRRAYLMRTYNRSKKFFPKVTTILNKYNLPNELKVLLALESAFNANAVSKAGAVGYWQIMDEVAKEYGLKYVANQHIAKKGVAKKGTGKNSKKAQAIRDDRKNFNKSTYAAARYLRDRSRNLDNDLLLMVASYNCGVGNVWEAMKRTGKSDADFWDIKDYLPAETRAYVMNFIALNVVFHNYDKFTKNTLLFTPTKVKVQELQGIAEESTDAVSSN
jgi:soluble lytic murein transglycosylase-like protein